MRNNRQLKIFADASDNISTRLWIEAHRAAVERGRDPFTIYITADSNPWWSYMEHLELLYDFLGSTREGRW